jgi:hypothetical protein
MTFKDNLRMALYGAGCTKDYCESMVTVLESEYLDKQKVLDAICILPPKYQTELRKELKL